MGGTRGWAAASSSTVRGHPETSERPSPLLYDAIATTCNASRAGTSVTTSVTNAIVETSYYVGDDPSTPEVEQGGDVKTTQAVPADPPPGYVIEGTLDHIGDRLIEALVGTGRAALAQGDYDQAESALANGLTLARRLGEAHAEAVALVSLGELALRRGERDRPEALFREALGLARTSALPFALGRALLGLGSLAQTVDPGAARAHFQEALSVAGGGSTLAYLASPSLRGLAEVAHAAGDLNSAQEGFEKALAVARTCGDKGEEAAALRGLGDLAAVRGDGALARARHHEALALAAVVGDPAAIAEALEALGALPAGRGAFPRCVRLLAAADAIRVRHGCVRRASVASASVEESARDALGPEGFAVEWARGAAMSTEAAVMLATSRRGQRVRRPSSDVPALTRSELRVAELAARGHTNAQIALELGIVLGTVKAHLHAVFTKLGLESRAALAARMYGPRGDDAVSVSRLRFRSPEKAISNGRFLTMHWSYKLYQGWGAIP